MRVLLVNPSQVNVYGRIGEISQPHMGLAYLAAVLERAGHKVFLLDIDADKIDSQKLRDNFKLWRIDILGITSTTPVIKNALAVARIAKQTNPEIKVVIGGIHATILPVTLARETEIDFVVRGEGEAVLERLVKTIENRQEPGQIGSLTYLKDGELVSTPDMPLNSNLDELPLPARHLFLHKKYSYPGLIYQPAFAIHTSRGCPGKCNFCQAKNFYGQRVRFRSAAAVAEEVEIIIKKFKGREIHVWDDNFAADKERVFKIAEELRRRNLSPFFSFTAGIRVDTAIDEDVLRAMRRMGGRSIAFGIESGSQQILESIGKGITLAQARRAVFLAKRLGFTVWLFFMLGFPEDSEETISQTISFARELDPHVVKFHILKPYPGSAVYEQLLKQGLICDFDFTHYGIHTFPVHRTKFLSRERLFELHQQAYRSFYLRPSVALRQVGQLRSAYQALGNLRSALGIFKVVAGND
jgi:magnesium-protoporphyrin IX monomethyl ester (oxidative) cyclase